MTENINDILVEYLHSVTTSRNTINNMINVMSNQDRTLRTIVNYTIHSSGTNIPSDITSEPTNMHNRRYRNNRHNIGYSYTTPVRVEEVLTPANLLSQLSNLNAGIPTPITTPIRTSSATAAQIANATEEVLFSSISNPLNNTCPISCERFEPNDMVMQIIPCGHIFTPDNLRQWFQTNQRCPLCRMDITRYHPQDTIRNPYTQTPPPSTVRNRSISEIADFISNDIVSQLSDISGNVSVEYSVLNRVPDASNSEIVYDSSYSQVINNQPYTYTT